MITPVINTRYNVAITKGNTNKDNIKLLKRERYKNIRILLPNPPNQKIST